MGEDLYDGIEGEELMEQDHLILPNISVHNNINFNLNNLNNNQANLLNQGNQNNSENNANSNINNQNNTN